MTYLVIFCGWFLQLLVASGGMSWAQLTTRFKLNHMAIYTPSELRGENLKLLPHLEAAEGRKGIQLLRKALRFWVPPWPPEFHVIQPPTWTYVKFCCWEHQAMWVINVKKVYEMWQSDLERGGDKDSRHTAEKTDKHIHTTSCISNGFFHIDENSERSTRCIGTWWKLAPPSRKFSSLHCCRRLAGTGAGRLWCYYFSLQGWRRRQTQDCLQGSHIIYLGLGIG